MSLTPCPKCGIRRACYVEADVDTEDRRRVCFLCGYAVWVGKTGGPLVPSRLVREDRFIDHSRQRTVRQP